MQRIRRFLMALFAFVDNENFLNNHVFANVFSY